VRAHGRVGVLSRQVGGGDHELEAFRVSGGGAVALVHVAAADPLGHRGHADLVASAVIANHRPDGVRTMRVVVAGDLTIGAARAAAAVD
jgi:hypothetical protein